jgi:hypothetical protein
MATATSVGTAPGSNTLQFQAQGIFNRNNNLNTAKFHDVTNNDSTVWNPAGNTAGSISYTGSNGLFIGVTSGCTFFIVSDGGFTQGVVVGVNTDPATCPAAPVILAKPPASPRPQ